MTPRTHQQQFVDKPFRSRMMLFWCMRSGKTLAATLYVKKYCDEARTLIICPLHLVAMWKKALPQALVYSKEQIKKQPPETLTNLDCIILDESHRMAASLFDNKKRSAIADHIYDIIALNQESKRLLLTGTPATNSFHSVHTQLYFLGVNIPWDKYREFIQVLAPMPYHILKNYNRFRATRGLKPMARVMMWTNRPDWRVRVDRVLAKYTNEGIIDRIKPEDIAEDLPPEEHVVVKVKGGAHECPEGEVCHWTHKHLAEQKNKAKWILDNPFDKVIIVGYYREMIDDMYDKLSPHRTCYKVYGGMSNKDEIIKAWQADPYGYLIISSSICEGWEGSSADCIIYCNTSHEFVSYAQMSDRLTTYDKPKQKIYYHLIGGKHDQIIHDAVVEAKQDFKY